MDPPINQDGNGDSESTFLQFVPVLKILKVNNVFVITIIISRHPQKRELIILYQMIL